MQVCLWLHFLLSIHTSFLPFFPFLHLRPRTSPALLSLLKSPGRDIHNLVSEATLSEAQSSAPEMTAVPSVVSLSLVAAEP